MKQVPMLGHQERCPVCQSFFVALPAEFQYAVNLMNTNITLKVSVCSIECAKEAIARLEENRYAARKADKWG